MQRVWTSSLPITTGEQGERGKLKRYERDVNTTSSSQNYNLRKEHYRMLNLQ